MTKKDRKRQKSIIRGTLFDSKTVKLDSESPKAAGSWVIRDDSTIEAYDRRQLKIFYEEMRKCESPVLYDIGANTGCYSLLPAIMPNMRVYAFEPNPDVFNILKNNIKLNNLSNLTQAFQIAIMDSTRVMELKIPEDYASSGLATLGKPKRFNEWNSVTVSSTKLDSFAKKMNLPKPTHIKIDTEGAEYFVLKGAEEIIRTSRPVIMMEYSKKNIKQFNYSHKEIKRLLKDWGYEFHHVSDEDILCHPIGE